MRKRGLNVQEMGEDMSLADYIPLYTFENAIEGAVLAYLTANSIPAYTRLTLPRMMKADGSGKPVPRVEIQFRPGPATHGKPQGANNKVVEDGFDGELALQIITQPSVEQLSATINSTLDSHGNLCASVRYLGADWFEQLNALLTYHKITGDTMLGSSSTLTSEDGIETTTLLWVMKFKIKDDAWPT